MELIIPAYNKFLLKGCSSKYLDLNSGKSKMIVSDCDGIITDGTSIFTKNGKVEKTYGSYDKEAIQFMKSVGWNIIFVTDDKAGFEITKSRLDSWGCNVMIKSSQERANYLKELDKRNFEVLAYIGDSMSDLLCKPYVTDFCTTNNAISYVRNVASYVSNNNGAHGGFAEILYHLHEKYKNIQ